MGCKLAKTIFANLYGSTFAEQWACTHTHTPAHIKLENELVKESELILVWTIWSVNTNSNSNGGAVFHIRFALPILSLSLSLAHSNKCFSVLWVLGVTKSGWVWMREAYFLFVAFGWHFIGVYGTDDTHILMHTLIMFLSPRKINKCFVYI